MLITIYKNIKHHQKVLKLFQTRLNEAQLQLLQQGHFKNGPKIEGWSGLFVSRWRTMT